MLNNNKNFIINRQIFHSDETIELIAKKTHLIEEIYEFLYQTFLKYFKSPNILNQYGGINNSIILKLFSFVNRVNTETLYFAKAKVRPLMAEKTSIIKRMIDIICVIHNQNEFKAIVPHPKFQNKGLSRIFIEFELRLLDIIKEIAIFIQWDKIEPLKDLFKYLINKILNQEKEGIKQLKEDEYTYHIGLYRIFGIFINTYCFNYSFNNKCTLFKSIQIFKETFFESKKQIEIFIDLLLKDYFKLFGFIAGCKNNYFNYYDSLPFYSDLYSIIKEAYLIDFSILKYLFSMSEKKN